MIGAAGGGGGSAVLLRAVNVIREFVIGNDVIELRSGLVVPSAPRRAGVQRDGCPLVRGQRHMLRIRRIHPELVIIVAARCAAHNAQSFSTLAQFVKGDVRNVDDVGIVRVGSD